MIQYLLLIHNSHIKLTIPRAGLKYSREIILLVRVAELECPIRQLPIRTQLSRRIVFSCFLSCTTAIHLENNTYPCIVSKRHYIHTPTPLFLIRWNCIYFTTIHEAQLHVEMSLNRDHYQLFTHKHYLI